jgi:hypothetical protein
MRISRLLAVSLPAVVVLAIAAGSPPLHGQQATANATIPTLVNFSGTLNNANAKPLTDVTGVTFSLYTEQSGGSPLWVETQNVQPDASGHYSVMLGSTSSQGLPSGLFASGQARWLEVEAQGQQPQARIMLLSVPYALKAGDAQTVGGLPASAFVLATPPNGVNGSATETGTTTQKPLPTGSSDVTTSGGTPGTVPYFSTATDIENSVITQTGTGSSAKVGINTATPASTLDIKGSSTVRGTLNLPSTKTATASQGYDSQPEKFQASAYNSGTETAVTQNFLWQAEPTGNNTSNASGTLNLLFSQGNNTPAETGLNIGSNGQVTFASGQTFPGTGNGTITGVTAGTGLSGGGTSGAVTLTNAGVLSVTAGGGIGLSGTGQNPTVSNTGVLGLTPGTGISIGGGQTPTVGINTSAVPQLGTANTFTGNQTINGNVSATGVVTGSSFQIGSNLFAFGSYASGNAFLGFGGSTTSQNTQYDTAVGYGTLQNDTTGVNTAVGAFALQANTTGSGNTATGLATLQANTTGTYNTANGADALYNNTTGISNTANGDDALFYSTTASYNTASGDDALFRNTTGSNNAASGYLSLSNNTTGSYNTAMGEDSLLGNLTANYNTAVGDYAGQALNSATFANNNTFVGAGAAGSGVSNLSNATAIGSNSEVAESNALVLGCVSGTNGCGASVNVGIGTTTPASALDVHGTVNVASPGNVVVNGSFISTTASSNLSETSSDAMQLGAYSSMNIQSGDLMYLSSAGPMSVSATLLTVSTSNVGIGTSSPDTLLSVNGGADKPGGGSWATFSDRRLKNLDGSFNSGLSQIMKINPVLYRYKADNAMGIRDTDEHVGLVAQEVQKAIPEAVTENSKGYLLVNNDPIIWTMLNAIKEQQKLIQKQQQKIAQLSTQVEAIQANLKTNGRGEAEVRRTVVRH